MSDLSDLTSLEDDLEQKSGQIDSDNEFVENEAEDAASDETSCDFCNDPSFECLHTNYSKSLEPPLKRIMALELLLHGLVSDKAIYARMCHEYNTKIHTKMIESGVKSVKWSPKKLRKHFDQHVRMIPRRVLAEQLQMLTRMSRLNYSQVCRMQALYLLQVLVTYTIARCVLRCSKRSDPKTR